MNKNDSTNNFSKIDAPTDLSQRSGDVVSAAMEAWEKNNDSGPLADILMSTGPGLEARKAALEGIRRLSAIQGTLSWDTPLTPKQRARITTVVCVGAAAAAKTTGGKSMAESMERAGVKVIWLHESATQCLNEVWDNNYPEEDWEALCFQVTLLLVQLDKETKAVLEAGDIVRQDDDAQVVILADRGLWDGQVYCIDPIWRATLDVVYGELGCSHQRPVDNANYPGHIYDVALHAISLATDRPEVYNEVKSSNEARQCDLQTAQATCPMFGPLYTRHAKWVIQVNNDGCEDHSHKAMKMLVQLHHVASEGLQDKLKPVLHELPVTMRLPHADVQKTTVCAVCGNQSPHEDFTAVGIQFSGQPAGPYQVAQPCWRPVCKKCEAVHERDPHEEKRSKRIQQAVQVFGWHCGGSAALSQRSQQSKQHICKAGQSCSRMFRAPYNQRRTKVSQNFSTPQSRFFFAGWDHARFTLRGTFRRWRGHKGRLH